MEITIDLDQIGVCTDGIDVQINGGSVYYDGYITIDSDDLDLPEQKVDLRSIPYSELVTEIVRREFGLEHLVRAYFVEQGRAEQ